MFFIILTRLLKELLKLRRKVCLLLLILYKHLVILKLINIILFIGDDEEIYANFVATTGLTAAYEELDTSRVVRISCSGFPQYFAILSRIKEEVRAIGADGGKVTSSHEPHVQAYFPKGIFAF